MKYGETIFGIIYLLFVIISDITLIIKKLWIYVLLSFLFYTIVVIGTNYIHILGMFMIPKTICYILIIKSFNNYSYIFK